MPRSRPSRHAHSPVGRTVAPTLLRSHGTGPDDPGRRARAATTICWHEAAFAETNDHLSVSGIGPVDRLARGLREHQNVSMSR